MAHFAKLGIGNIVERVEVVSDDVATTQEAGIDFLNNLYGTNDTWRQTSYNSNIRKNFAGIGHTYNETKDAFIPPQPYPSWILDEDTCTYNPPVVKPQGNYVWNELHRKWEEVTND